MAQVIRSKYTFIGNKAEDSAKYFDIILSHSPNGDASYLAWDAAHKFGTRVICEDFVSFRFGIIRGKNAQQAAEAFDECWAIAFSSCPEVGRRKIMKFSSNQLKATIEKDYSVSINVLDSYYF